MFLLGFRQFCDPYYQGFAAQIAFYIMLSIVPTVILLSQLLGIIDISMNFLDNWIDKYVSAQMAVPLKQALSSRSSISNTVILFLTALWAASRAQFALMRITNYTYTSGRTTGNYFLERYRSLKTMFLTVLTITFVVIVLVYGKQILIVIFGDMIKSSLIVKIWTWLRWPVAVALYFLVVIYEYYVTPREKKPLESLVPGAVAAAVGMLLVTMVYSFYTGYIVDYGLIYGGLSSIVALLFWFFFLSWVLVLGVIFNKVWEDTKGDIEIISEQKDRIEEEGSDTE